MQNKANLGKNKMNVSAVITMHYDNSPLPRCAQNKPNQTQFSLTTAIKSSCESVNIHVNKEFKDKIQFGKGLNYVKKGNYRYHGRAIVRWRWKSDRSEIYR